MQQKEMPEQQPERRVKKRVADPNSVSFVSVDSVPPPPPTNSLSVDLLPVGYGLSDFESMRERILSFELVVSFDGACRNNGRGNKSEVQSSCAAVLFHATASSVMSMVPLALKLPTVNTNNKAEILGCVQAIKLAIECFKKTGRTVYRIVGDSTYVIQALQNHKLTTLTLQKSDQTNWDEWNQLRAVLAAMPTEMQVTFSWIPRSLNAASDRLANNVLDAQEYDVDFCKEHPPIPMILPDDEIYHRVEDFWFQARPSCRYLSNFLIQPWKVAFFNILRLAINNPKSVEPWAMLLSLPKVLLFPQPKAAQKTFISQNSSYEKFVELFRVTVGSPRPERGESTMQSPPNVAQVVEKLVAQNRIAKALDVIEGSRVAVQKPTMSACTQFWPRRQDDIHVFPDVPLATIQFASILAATRKFSKGRAPDILGWNKELFLPIVTSADDDEKLLLEQFFFLIANDMLPSSITTILTCDKGMFLGTPEKSRPIVMSNFFGKVLWKMTFMRRELDRYFPSQDPAATAAIIAHSVADLNMRIIKLDGKNAFQSMVRAAIFDAIRDIKDPLFCRRWNQCYGAVTSIAVYNPDGTVFGMIDSTTGVRAGCVSASKLFQIAMKRAMLPSMLQIVDDIHYFLPENESWERAEQLLRDTLAYTAVDFFGPKTKFIGPGHHESSFETLGVVIPYNGAESIDALVKKKYQPVKTMIKKIVEIDDVSLQVKLFLLRATELKLRYMFEASLCPAMNQWSETIDNDVFEAISSLFSLKEMPTTRHALISTPVGHGGIGLAQFALRQPWNQCRLTQRVLAMIQRPEHRYFAFCEPSVQGKLRDFPPHLLEVKADEHIVRAIREHPYFQQDKFVYATISQHHPPQRHLLLEIPAEPFKIKDNAMKALIWTRLCHLPRCPHPVCVRCRKTIRISTFRQLPIVLSTHGAPQCSPQRHLKFIHSVRNCTIS